MKTLLCRDAGFDCDAQIQAPTNEEVLALAARHASTIHQVTVTPELATALTPLIRDDG